MTSRPVLLIIGSIALVGILIIIGLLASRIGGIAIRNSATHLERGTISLSQPALRGVPVTVRWGVPPAHETTPLVLSLRDRTGEQVLPLRQASATAGQIVLPCTGDETNVTLLVRAASDELLLASGTITLLPPGPECL